jgi:hypothetical protein
VLIIPCSKKPLVVSLSPTVQFGVAPPIVNAVEPAEVADCPPSGSIVAVKSLV